MDAALSLRTVYTPVGSTPPYEDAEGPDGLLAA
jgi:putative restriction endonuclease